MRRSSRFAGGLLVLVVLFAKPVSLEAQAAGAVRPVQANPRGFFLGAALTGNGITSEDLSDDEAESGGGVSLSLGWQFTPLFALFVEGTAATMSPAQGGDQYVMGHFDIGGRFHFVSPTRRVVPFLDVAYSGRVLRQEDVTLFTESGNSTTGTLDVGGTGVSVGGGLNVHLSPGFALQGGLRVTSGKFTTIKFSNVTVDGLSAKATSARVNLGMVWYPMQGKSGSN